MGTLGTLLRTPQGSHIVGRLSLTGAPLFVCLGGHIFSAFLSVFQSGHIFGGGPTSPVFGGPSVLSVCDHGRLLEDRPNSSISRHGHLLGGRLAPSIQDGRVFCDSFIRRELPPWC